MYLSHVLCIYTSYIYIYIYIYIYMYVKHSLKKRKDMHIQI